MIQPNHGRPQEGRMGICPSLVIGTKNQNFLKNLTLACICCYDTCTAQEPVHCSGVM